MSSTPYEMATMKENCKQVKKSPHILRNLPLTERTILACATVILPGLPLLRASFHVAPFEGHIHIIPFQNKARILPDLKYDSDSHNEDLETGILSWKFVADCEGKITRNESINENELGVDSRASFTIEIPRNFTFQMLRLLLNGEMLACAPILNVEERQVKRGLHLLSQAHYFEPVRSASDFTIGNLHIRDDCLDIATETVHSNFENFYPTMNIFGMDSVVLKSLVANNSCGPLRPQFPRPAATAYFMYPVVGRLVLVDMDDQILLTGELRQLRDSSAMRATVQASSDWAHVEKCPQCLTAESCHTVEGAALIVGRDEPIVTLNSVFPWFQLSTKRSIIVDLQWTKVCANLTQLTSGALSAHALIKRISLYSAPVVASIVVLEYPANNYTEALVNKHQIFSGATAHSRPLDLSITNSEPCSEANLGPNEEKWWIDRLRTILASEENDTTVIIGSKQLVTGVDSVLGTSILLLNQNEVSCGHFEPLTEKTIVVAKFDKLLRGYIKMVGFTC
ncbi:unnamed protein product [Angiostrongylus costaricensis]|uniref:Protein kinase domain-containing protein n=1 Tax=Angiostrongylus costaricensis TaxID=334426 RepID=A0A0R3PCQ7_ANGCS|nr:unnamed protein product [Angiostrongylus costaricensis]